MSEPYEVTVEEEMASYMTLPATIGECESCKKADIVRGGICKNCYEFHAIDRRKCSYSEKLHKKEPIPDKIRWAVWERDNFTCQDCGARKNLTVDHITPESNGGKLTMENCQTLCKSCNSKKGAR